MTDLRHQLESTLSGSYTLERELGGGGMSRVFLADEVRLGRKVVVKVLSPELAAGISAERFEREIKLAASLQQANIVPVLSAGDTNGLPYYTMPFVDGQSLRGRLGGDRPLSTTEIIGILRDVSRALQYAHERGIVHRDIKPDNVLLSGGTAVVTDFGIAKALSAARRAGDSAATLTQLGTSIGTPAYMAPEQAAGDPDVDARADIYAFGCMAYELLAGHPPFHSRTPARVLAAHMGETPQPIGGLRPDISPALADLVMRCLEKDTEARPQSAAEITRVLDTVTSGGSMDALPPVLLHGPGAFRKALVAYVVGAVAFAIVARAATIVIGLPDWVFPGALVVMALGLPVILFTGYAQSVTRRAITATPPVGTMATLALKASPHLSWKRTTRGGIIAAGAFAFIVAAFMVMRAFGIGPAASLFASGALKARDGIMVADFAVNHADSSVGSVVAEAVRTNLEQSPSIVLATPSAVAAALVRMQRPKNTRLDLDVAREVAQRQGYKAIVTGDVTGLGSGYVIALKLVTPDSGAVLASFQTTVNGPADLVNGVDGVAKKLRAKMGESLKSVQASPPLAQVSTASIEALRQYTIGARANDVDLDYTTAADHLRQAVRLDSGFAMAWRKLSVALNNNFAPQSAVDSAITRAHALPAHLSERERLQTDAFYYEFGPGHDRAKAADAYEALLKLGDTMVAANNLSVILSQRRDFARAESLLRATIRNNPDAAIHYGNLLPILRHTGRFAEHAQTIAQLRKRFPGSSGQWNIHEMSAMYDAGDTAAFFAALDTARSSSNFRTADYGLHVVAMRALLHGQIRSSGEATLKAEAYDSSHGSPPLPGETRLTVDTSAAWLLPSDPALLREIDSLLPTVLGQRLATDRPYPHLAQFYARAGRPDKARAMLGRMRAEVRDTALVRSWTLDIDDALGEIALAEQRGAEAVDEFRKGDRLPDGPGGPAENTLDFNLARAFDVANKQDSAIVYFERALTAPNAYRVNTEGRWLGGIYKRLGELYEARGDKTKAESYLTKFVTLWAKADPALQPQVADAKRRLARLRDREGR